VAEALPGAVVGGVTGTLAGFMDIWLVPPYVNLLDSDNLAGWRENRPVVVILNAGCCALLGALIALIGHGRRRA
jgi:hypothetical protein